MRKAYYLIAGLALLLAGIQACRKSQPFPEAAMDQRMSGGDDYTIFDASSSAFSTMVPGLTDRDQFVHGIGDKFFEANFVSAPAPVNPGLGPLFNNISCASCHQRDGRGRPPLPGESLRAMLVRISVPGKAADGGPRPVPGFGAQLQDKALNGVAPEAGISISYSYREEQLADGTTVELREPHIAFSHPYLPLPADLLYSPRIASSPLGAGLIDAIPDAEILKMADADDRDGNGISGKPNWVFNHTTQRQAVGRFGWKANVADVLGQVASAFQQDMGVTNAVFPKESSQGQPQFPGGQEEVHDIPDSVLHAVVFYMRTLAVPARRNVGDANILHGAQVFAQTGCAGCHRPTLLTGVNVSFPLLSNQVIHPYSDFLLHDMGPELADGRPDYDASGSEWKTPPLWGIGLTEKVSGYTYYMHDGRARTLPEAILWHGGEAGASKEAFRQLDATDREALLAFLNSL